MCWDIIIANRATLEQLARYAKAERRKEFSNAGISFPVPPGFGPKLIPNEFMPENYWILLPQRERGENYLEWFMRGAIMIGGEVMKLNEIRQTNGIVVQRIDDEAQVKIVFDDATGERLKQIKKAEEHLRKAGLDFDTGYHLAGEHKDRRVWQFDWSLQGASVVYKGPAKNEEQEK